MIQLRTFTNGTSVNYGDTHSNEKNPSLFAPLVDRPTGEMYLK